VLEFAGDGVKKMSLDERATLTNMAVEAGGFTGIIEADEVVVDYLTEMRGLPPTRSGADRARRPGRQLRCELRDRPRKGGRDGRDPRRPAQRRGAQPTSAR
jgi:hypothetical protein